MLMHVYVLISGPTINLSTASSLISHASIDASHRPKLWHSLVAHPHVYTVCGKGSGDPVHFFTGPLFVCIEGNEVRDRPAHYESPGFTEAEMFTVLKHAHPKLSSP